MTVRRILDEKGRDVVTCRAGATLSEIVDTLTGHRIGAVVITEGERIRGIVSERDVVAALAAHGPAALDQPAEDCMTEEVTTCTPSESIHELMQKMTEGRFRHIPVVEDGRLAGIVSIGDVVKRRIEEVEREAAQMREYIATA
ncbi:MAG TPA: CBS domain-containing protein [Afifellaceae bacterium]|nr:CBS domain-containing protein [Afifellaceae bacterium]